MAETVLARERVRRLRSARRRRRPPVALVALIAASLLLALVVGADLAAVPGAGRELALRLRARRSPSTRLAAGRCRPRAPFSTEQVLAGSASNADQAAALARSPAWSGTARAYDALARRRTASSASSARRDGGGGNPASSNPPLYYLVESRRLPRRGRLRPLRPAAGDADRLAAVAGRHGRRRVAARRRGASAATGCSSSPRRASPAWLR